MKNWNTSDGDYIIDDVQDSPYEKYKSFVRLKKISVSVIYLFAGSGVLVVLLSLIKNMRLG